MAPQICLRQNVAAQQRATRGQHAERSAGVRAIGLHRSPQGPRGERSWYVACRMCVSHTVGGGMAAAARGTDQPCKGRRGFAVGCEPAAHRTTPARTPPGTHPTPTRNPETHQCSGPRCGPSRYGDDPAGTRPDPAGTRPDLTGGLQVGYRWVSGGRGFGHRNPGGTHQSKRTPSRNPPETHPEPTRNPPDPPRNQVWISVAVSRPTPSPATQIAPSADAEHTIGQPPAHSCEAHEGVGPCTGAGCGAACGRRWHSACGEV